MHGAYAPDPRAAACEAVKPKKPARITWQIVPNPGALRWKIVRDGADQRPLLTQREAIEEVDRLAEYEFDVNGRPSEILIHNGKGRIREKNTFPRSSDPREFRG